MIRGRLRFTRATASRATLNDALTDPLDEHDLRRAQPEEAAELRQALEALLAARAAGEDGELQNEAALRALGYLGGTESRGAGRQRRAPGRPACRRPVRTRGPAAASAGRPGRAYSGEP